MAYKAQSMTGSAEVGANRMVTKIKQGHKSGMADRKKGRKKGVNCSTGKYSTK